MKILLTTVFYILTLSLHASDAVVPHDDDYYKFKENNVEIIYTEDHIPYARHTASIENPLNSDYEKLYDWKLDETLYVCLISNHNQIANGFSTQWPNNRQVNYVGGTQLIDRFSSTSWLDTLLYHETAHNYQLNVKGNRVSRGLHSVLGNGSFYFFLPFWIVPNMFENSFMLEGNAVLNESWHGNGGRLYNGRYKAETILQAAAGKIKPGEVYNEKIEFPYGNIHYIQGGFYNYYLAQKYGMSRLNRYFKHHSESYLWPQFTNRSMKKAIGIDFEKSLKEFSYNYAKKAKDLVLASGEKVASSQFFYSLSNNNDEICFLTNESGRRAPQLNVIDKSNFDISKRNGGWLGGKVIKVDDEYYTQGSSYTSVTRIHQGLFDSDRVIKDSTQSKMVQGYLSDGTEVYFDVTKSFSQAQLYVGESFYATVNSSVVIDKDDNLYYFVQNKKERILYKNKKAIYAYKGFYGIVSDVDSSGAVYFVANSENGSTLYRYKDKKVTRASSADNIVEARLVNDDEVLLACVSDKDYYYVKNNLQSINNTPYETKLFFEDADFYGEYKEAKTAQKDYAHIGLDKSYNAFLDMHYSGSNIFAQYTDKKIFGDMNIYFSDPLNQNSVSAFVSKSESNVTMTGASYSNSKYLLNYSVLGYKMLDKGNDINARDYGLIVNTLLPLYKKGYERVNLTGIYFQDALDNTRAPFNASLSFSKEKTFGASMYTNYLNKVSFLGSYEKENKVIGAEYSFQHDLYNELYLYTSAKYSHSKSDTKGVKVTGSPLNQASDQTTIVMPSLDGFGYIKYGGYVDIGVSKVLNHSRYWFTFPISLQREALYGKYRHYELVNFFDNKLSFNEYVAGATFSTVWFNKAVLPISIEYIYTDAEFINEPKKILIFVNASF